MSNIELVIDNREHALIKQLSNKTEYVVEQLQLGDIVFREAGEIILVIERKTIEDLKASICDGRNREQKARLLGCIEANRIMYLIEGSLDHRLDTKVSGLPISTLIGSLINTQLRDGIKTYKTASIKESANFLVKLKSKLEKDLPKFFRAGGCISDTKYAASLKKSKKANMTPSVWFIKQLSLIPQVTERISEKIIEKYSNMCDLVGEYTRTPEHLRSKLLADIKYEIKNGKLRRIGNKISERIYKFFFNITE